MNTKILLLILSLSFTSCAFKKSEEAKVYKSPVLEMTSLPKIQPLLGSLNAKAGLLLGNDRESKLITLTSREDFVSETSPLRNYLLSEVKKSTGDFSYEFKFDDRFLKLERINDFSYDDLIKGRFALINFKESPSIQSRASLELSYKLSLKSLDLSSSYSEILLGLYILKDGKLISLSKETSTLSNGKLYSLSSKESSDISLDTLKVNFTNLPSKTLEETLSLASPLYLAVEDFKTSTSKGITESQSEILSRMLKTKSRVIVSLEDETKIFYPDSNESLLSFLKKTYQDVSLDSPRDFSSIGEFKSTLVDLRNEDLQNLLDESLDNRPIGRWFYLAEENHLPEELMSPSKTYVLIYLTPKELLSSVLERKELLKATLSHEDSKSASLSLGNLKNGDLVEISFKGSLNKQKLSSITKTYNFQRSKCTQGTLSHYYCKQFGRGYENDRQCYNDEFRIFGIEECAKALNEAKNYRYDSMDNKQFVCEKEEILNYTCETLGLIPTLEESKNLPFEEKAENIRAYLVVANQEFKLSEAQEIVSLKGDSEDLLWGSAQIKIMGLPSHKSYPARIELRPDLDGTEFRFGKNSSNCPADASGTRFEEGLIHEQDLQTLHLKIDYLGNRL